MLATIGDDELLVREAQDADVLDLAWERIELQDSFHKFVVAAWHVVEPTQAFTDNWHVRVFCGQLEDLYYRRGAFRPPAEPRFLANVPPGTLKSLLTSVFFPAWVWTLNSKKRFLTGAYGAHLSTRDALRTRQIIESRWYQDRWPVKLADDQNTKTRYNTDGKGWRVSTSVDGVGTGEHPDFIIVDDPHSASDAASDKERQTAIDWFDQTLSTRLGRNPAIIVIMQRLHQEDLSGHLLKRGGWVHVCWPMRYEQCTCHPTDADKKCLAHKADPSWRPDPLDPRTTHGELLFPALFPEQKIRQLELDLGPYGAAGQLQQRPSPEGGGLFKRGWFKFVDAAPKLARRVRGWDTAATEGGGDATCGVKMSEEFETRTVNGKTITESTGRIIVEDVQHDHLGPAGVDQLMRTTAELDGKSCPQREEREGGASGKAQIAGRAKLLVGFDYQETQLGANKLVRAKPYRAQCEAGNVYLVRAPWNEAYLVELAAFPTGEHDDRVDGSSCAFNSLLLEPAPRKQRCTW